MEIKERERNSTKKKFNLITALKYSKLWYDSNVRWLINRIERFNIVLVVFFNDFVIVQFGRQWIYYIGMRSQNCDNEKNKQKKNNNNNNNNRLSRTVIDSVRGVKRKKCGQYNNTYISQYKCV